jgi:hypothetical protein
MAKKQTRAPDIDDTGLPIAGTDERLALNVNPELFLPPPVNFDRLPISKHTQVWYDIRGQKWLGDAGFQSSEVGAMAVVGIFHAAVAKVHVGPIDEGGDEYTNEVRDKSGELGPSDSPEFCRLWYDPLFRHLGAKYIVLDWFDLVDKPLTGTSKAVSLSAVRQAVKELSELPKGCTEHLFQGWVGRERFSALLTSENPGFKLLEVPETGRGTLDIGAVTQPKVQDTKKTHEDAQKAEGISSDIVDFLDDAETAEERKARAALVWAELPADARQHFLSAAAETYGLDLSQESLGTQATPAIPKGIRLTVEQMQEELDKRTGRSFGSVEANQAEIDEIKGYLKASNLQLLYRKRPVNIRLGNATASPTGSFVLRTTGTVREHVYSDPAWPPLTAAPSS